MSIAIEATVAAVTILEDRASITRRGGCSLAAGQHRLVIERVAPVLADKTLLARATGGRVLDVRCERYLAGAFKRGAEVWPVFSVRGLLESADFLRAAAS